MLRTQTVTRSVIGIPAALLVVFMLLLLLALAGGASGDIPGKINYQGRLVDGATNLPLAGLHSLTFRIYESSAGGTLLWAETKTEAADSDGVFSTVLGSVNPIGISFATPRWLEIEVDGQVMAPRRELVSVPSAFQASNADMLDGLSPDAFADSSVDGHSLDAADGNPGDAVYVDNSGRVGVGTSTPATFLDVRTLGSAEGGVAPYGEVVSHFKIEGSTAHSAISIDGQAGKDAILYLAEDGEAAWDIRKDADIGNKLQIRHHRPSGTSLRPVTIDTTGYIGVSTTEPNGPLQVESSINLNNDGATNFTNRIAPVVVGDGDGTGACILVDGNQIEQAAPSHELFLNFNSPSDIILAGGGGDVGIGTTSPDARLDVAGQVKITGGSPAAGKVLSSDAAGLASWQALDVEHMVSPMTMVLYSWAAQSSTVWFMHAPGYTMITTSDDFSSTIVYVPIELPSKLAGVNQRIKSVKIHYRASSECYISATELRMATTAGGDTDLASDLTSRKSASWTSYTLTDPSPDIMTGPAAVEFVIQFGESHQTVDIGPIVVTTGP